MKLIKNLLIPFSLIYGGLVWLRNKLFDSGILPSNKFDFPVISIGNLSMGGTGKTPHIEYFLSILNGRFRTGVVSRGYKRKSKGYHQATLNSTVEEIGDEPLQMKMKFPFAEVAVGEERVIAIPELLGDAPETEVILLDDAFQHRAVKPGLNILLTQYGKLFCDDHVFPAGTLREFPSGYKRADLIIVTKCPAGISETEKLEIRNKINPMPNQHLFFSFLEYGELRTLQIFTGPPGTERGKGNSGFDGQTEVLLFSGIAGSGDLVKHLRSRFKKVTEMKFADHFNFRPFHVRRIISRFEGLSAKNKIIVTTEKDAMRLRKPELKLLLEDIPVFCLPVKVVFGKDDESLINNIVVDYIKNNLEQKGFQEDGLV